MASEDGTTTGATADENLPRITISENRNAMLKELKKQVADVDSTMECLANLFDVLYNKLTNNAEEMQRNIKRQQDQEERNENNTILMETVEKMSELIQYAKDVQSRKVDAMKSLSKLIHFIHADREEICNEKYLDKCKSLTIDKYLSSQEFSRENGDTLVEMLQEQNNRLQLKYKLSREHVQIVSEREKLLNNERNQLEKNLKDLKKKLQKFKSAVESGEKFTFDDDFFKCPSNLESDHSDHADGGAPISNVEKSKMNRHTTSPIEQGIIRGVQSNNSDVKSYEEVERRIEYLQSKLKETEAQLVEKERLLQSVECRNGYEVNMVHQNSNKQSRVELELIKRMNEGMELQKCGLNVKKDTHVRSDSKYITIVTCALEPKDRSWESVLKTIEYSCSDLSKIILVVFYEYYQEKKLEESVASMCETLEKFRSVFQLQCGMDVLYRCPTEIRDILQIIIDNGNDRLEVASCSYCKKR